MLPGILVLEGSGENIPLPDRSVDAVTLGQAWHWVNPDLARAEAHRWLTVVTIAADLTSWLRLIALPSALKDCEPKALRYRFLHVPARLTKGVRRRHLRLPATWPWVTDAVATFTNVMAVPMLT